MFIKLFILLFFGTYTIQSVYGQNMAKNLSAITWSHATNSQKLLQDVLNSSIEMIEADVIFGTMINDASGKLMPVMGHPPANESDISLKDFLDEVFQFNINHTDNLKGIKLDFKSIEVFEESLGVLTEMWNLMDYPVWINADIISGPVNNTETTPVDPHRFFNGCKNLSAAVLSIGWTTRWGSDFNEGSYTDNEIDEMINAININNITHRNHEITFPVRAGIAAQSKENLLRLYSTINSTNPTTLTIWSGDDDKVNVEALRDLIFRFGVDKVYVDVPDGLASKLDLGNNSASKVNNLNVYRTLLSCAIFFLMSYLFTN